KSATGKHVPILANITEFGQTPLYNCNELAQSSVDMVLYPLSAFRAMNKAAENVYKHLLVEGNQEALLDSMQTRKELYEHLNYHDYENKLDQLFSSEG
ncbi:methylisocitrate lyase, partial [Vibrio sp. 10N.222.48.A3]